MLQKASYTRLFSGLPHVQTRYGSPDCRLRKPGYQMDIFRAPSKANRNRTTHMGDKLILGR